MDTSGESALEDEIFDASSLMANVNDFDAEESCNKSTSLTRTRSASSSKTTLNAENFQYLVGTTHFDPDPEDGGGVFKCLKVVEEEFEGCKDVLIVVYRAKLLPDGQWLDLPDVPINLGDVVKYHEDKNLQQEKELRMSNISTPVNSNHGLNDEISGEVDEYTYLINTMHYDPDYRRVFKVIDVRVEGFEGDPFIVCYRDVICTKECKWIPEQNRKGERVSIHVRDVKKYHENRRYQAKLNTTLNRLPKKMSV